MSLLRYPRLPTHLACSLALQHAAVSVLSLEKARACQHDSAIYAPVGGTRVSSEVLAGIGDSVVGVARACGYPSTLDRKAAREFDARVAETLHREMGISPHEASAAGVWQFIACIVLPHVVRWRFPGRSGVTIRERFVGGVRNAFQRLWWRAELLQDDATPATPYHLVGRLNEDELVQLMERSTLAGDRALIRRTAMLFLELTNSSLSRDAPPESRRMALMRDVQRRIMRLTSIVDFSVLNDSELRGVLEPVFIESLSLVRKVPVVQDETPSYDQ